MILPGVSCGPRTCHVVSVALLALPASEHLWLFAQLEVAAGQQRARRVVWEPAGATKRAVELIRALEIGIFRAVLATRRPREVRAGRRAGGGRCRGMFQRMSAYGSDPRTARPPSFIVIGAHKRRPLLHGHI